MSELKKKGISYDIISEVISDYSIEIQTTRINKIINRLIKSNRTRSGLMLKKKILMDLVNLGYDKELCTKEISTYDIITDEKILKREYEKLYQKYSKKYSDQELTYIIKKKMYEKGFDISSIN